MVLFEPSQPHKGYIRANRKKIKQTIYFWNITGLVFPSFFFSSETDLPKRLCTLTYHTIVCCKHAFALVTQAVTMIFRRVCLCCLGVTGSSRQNVSVWPTKWAIWGSLERSRRYRFVTQNNKCHLIFTLHESWSNSRRPEEKLCIMN